MPSTCAVPNCRSRGGPGVKNLRFFHININRELKDLSVERIHKWLKAINRTDVDSDSIKNLRTCSKHFVSGMPAKITNFEDIDWIPSLNLGEYKSDYLLSLPKRKCFREENSSSNDKCGTVAKHQEYSTHIKTAGGSTSGLQTHLKRNNDENLMEIFAPESPSCSNNSSGLKNPATESILKYVNAYEDDQTLPAVVSRMIAKDGISFKVFCTSLDLHKLLIEREYENIPKSPNTILEMVRNYADNIKAHIRKELQFEIKNGRRFSITLDEWTSTKNKLYVNLNIHTFSEFYNLGLLRIKGSLPADKCGQLITKKLEEYNVSVKNHIVCMTTNGASVMKKIEQILSVEQQLCFAHAIQLAVIDKLYKKQTCPLIKSENIFNCENEHMNNDDDDNEEEEDDYDDNEYDDDSDNGFDVSLNKSYDIPIILTDNHNLRYIIDKVRKVVKMFRRSPLKNEILQKFVMNDFGKELPLKLDTVTRWNSLLDMLDRFYQIRYCVQEALIDLNSNLKFDSVELKTIKSVINWLMPVKCAIMLLCREDSNLLKADDAILLMMANIENSVFGMELKSSIKSRVNERRTYLSNIIQYLHTAKINGTGDNVFEQISTTMLTQSIIQLAEQLFYDEDENNLNIDIYDVVIKEEIIDIVDEDDVVNKNVEICDESDPLQDVINSQTKIQESSTSFKKETNLSKIIKKEMVMFENGGNRGHYLNDIYEYLLSIPPTSIDSERAFCSTNEICTKVRSTLSDRSINDLCFLRSYFNKNRKSTIGEMAVASNVWRFGDGHILTT